MINIEEQRVTLSKIGEEMLNLCQSQVEQSFEAFITFDTDIAFLALINEMDKMNNDFSRGLQYRYYWLVSVDIKRNGLPLEESLLKNLNKAGIEFGVSSSSLKKLYSKTIALF